MQIRFKFLPIATMAILAQACLSIAAVHADPVAQPAKAMPDLAQTVPPHPLPPPSITHHTLKLAGRDLHFKATAGAIRLSDAQSGAPIADVAFTAFELEGQEAAKRPLTVAINGGPGAASAWLDLGAIGPWRLPVQPQDISPSASPAVVDNADTWLDFTDLLFIDPVGTGYSRFLGKSDEAQKSFYSVDGDIDTLATVIRKWLVANGRLASPKYIFGESYGGFRAPKIARRLESTEGVGVNGVIMLSPVLDFAWFHAENNPAVVAAHLPSLVAAARGLKGRDPRQSLKAVESYASGPYLVDLYKGRRDPAAVRRMSLAVANFTGLDPKFVERLGGRVDASVMMREKDREDHRIASSYDTNVTGYDPHPFDYVSHHEDPILDALKVPLAAAMADVDAERLKWPVQAPYQILNMQVNGRWDWDHGLHAVQAMSDLEELLSLDPRFHALVMHGVTDQVTPYYVSKMLIDQMPPYGDTSRIRLAVYAGGHMPYLDDGSRAAMRDDARTMIGGAPASDPVKPASSPTP